tara:strand:- start:8487 stop:10334 length:1848 start_codon:yes stop_codon:yes gene_type:complete
MSNNNLKVSNLDFDDIKTDIKTFMSAQDKFQDYNFEGSALGTVIDVLAYVTHYNALSANMALNEAFIDSAQLRESVVSHAKLLGYTPRSAYSAVAYIDVLINSPTGIDGGDGTLLPMTMDKGTQFSTSIDGKTYYFVTDQTLTIEPDINGVYKYSNVKIMQGLFRDSDYIYDVDTSEKYIMPFATAVTSSLTVTIQTSSSSSEYTTYVRSTDVSAIDAATEVYYLTEGRDGYYDVSFGDGVLGKKLTNGNIIHLNYITNDTSAANGASSFTLNDTIQSNSDVTITLIQKALGGSDKEDIESIRFNAPLGFVSQNRAVTPDDYKSIIVNSYANIDAISVWGGEDNDPPDYGKVYISIKPKDAEVVPDADKVTIISQYLKPKNVVSITPTLIDPTYTYIHLETYFKYNPNHSDLSVDSLENLVRTSITTYNNNELKRFDGVFRHSQILKQIDASSIAILNSTCRVFMKKRFTPALNTEAKYTLVFSSPILKSSSADAILKSTAFTYKTKQCVLTDTLENGIRHIHIGLETDPKTIIVNKIGTIEESTGKVILDVFNPTAIIGTYIEVTVEPNSNDLAPKRNELLTILYNESVIQGEVDTMVTGGTSAGVNYTTTARS